MKTKKSNAKKLLSLLLVLLLAMSLLAGCGSQNDSGNDSHETVENKVSAIVNVAATLVAPPFITAAPQPISTSTIVPTPSASNFFFIIILLICNK